MPTPTRNEANINVHAFSELPMFAFSRITSKMDDQPKPEKPTRIYKQSGEISNPRSYQPFATIHYVMRLFGRSIQYHWRYRPLRPEDLKHLHSSKVFTLIDSIPLEIPTQICRSALDEAPEVSIRNRKFAAFHEIRRLVSIGLGGSKWYVRRPSTVVWPVRWM